MMQRGVKATWVDSCQSGRRTSHISYIHCAQTPLLLSTRRWVYFQINEKKSYREKLNRPFNPYQCIPKWSLPDLIMLCKLNGGCALTDLSWLTLTKVVWAAKQGGCVRGQRPGTGVNISSESLKPTMSTAHPRHHYYWRRQPIQIRDYLSTSCIQSF